jgi:hypothetical protein
LARARLMSSTRYCSCAVGKAAAKRVRDSSADITTGDKRRYFMRTLSERIREKLQGEVRQFTVPQDSESPSPLPFHRKRDQAEYRAREEGFVLSGVGKREVWINRAPAWTDETEESKHLAQSDTRRSAPCGSNGC